MTTTTAAKVKSPCTENVPRQNETNTHKSTRYDNYALITPLWGFYLKNCPKKSRFRVLVVLFQFFCLHSLCLASVKSFIARCFDFIVWFVCYLGFRAFLLLVFASTVSTFLDRSFADSHTAFYVQRLSIAVPQLLLHSFSPETLPLKRAKNNILCTQHYASRGSHLFTIFVPMAVINVVSFCCWFLPSRVFLFGFAYFARFRWHSIDALQTSFSP